MQVQHWVQHSTWHTANVRVHRWEIRVWRHVVLLPATLWRHMQVLRRQREQDSCKSGGGKWTWSLPWAWSQRVTGTEAWLCPHHWHLSPLACPQRLWTPSQTPSTVTGHLELSVSPPNRPGPFSSLLCLVSRAPPCFLWPPPLIKIQIKTCHSWHLYRL